MKSKLIYLLPVVIMCGCSVYHKYETPQLAAPESFRNTYSEDTTTIASLSWRQFLSDPHLQTLIDTVLTNNTDLKVARLKVKEAEATLLNARLAYLPSVELNADGSLSRTEGATVKTYNIGLSANWEIDIFGKISNAKRGAIASLEESEAYSQAVRSQLIATVANSYYTLSMLDAQLDINSRTLENWLKTIHTLEALKKPEKQRTPLYYRQKPT